MSREKKNFEQTKQLNATIQARFKFNKKKLQKKKTKNFFNVLFYINSL